MQLEEPVQFPVAFVFLIVRVLHGEYLVAAGAVNPQDSPISEYTTCPLIDSISRSQPYVRHRFLRLTTVNWVNGALNS